MGDFAVEFKTGGCSDCTNCGLCDKGKENKISMVVDTKGDNTESLTQYDYIVEVDFGLTTTAMYLINPETKEQAGVFTCLNPQHLSGKEAIKRIKEASEECLAELQSLLVETVSGGISKLLKDRKASLVVITGNTVFAYLFMGYELSKTGKYPYRVRKGLNKTEQIADINVELMPGISENIGGNVVSGMVTLNFLARNMNAILIDIGATTEIVGMADGRIVALGVDSGKAFEQKVFGTALIKGLCELLEGNYVSKDGILSEEYFETGIKVDHILITQTEIRNLQTAKASVAAGIDFVLGKLGTDVSKMDHLYIAGGFGYYLDVESAFNISMFPSEFRNITETVGNASLDGVADFGTICNISDAQSKILQMIESIDVYDASEIPDFNGRMATNMQLA